MMNDRTKEGGDKMNEELELEEVEDLEFADNEVDEDEAEGEAEEVTFSAKEIASELGMNPKDFRRWLRSQTTDRANKGGRWAFTAQDKADWIARYQAKDEVEAVEADAEAEA